METNTVSIPKQNGWALGLLLSGAYYFFSQGDLSRDVLWFLPLIFLLSCFSGPSLEKLFSWDFLSLGLLLLGLGSVCISFFMQLPMEPLSFAVMGCLLAAALSLPVLFYQSRKGKSLTGAWSAILLFITAAAILLAWEANTPTKLGELTAWSQMFSFLRTSNWIYLLIACHGLAALLLYCCRSGNSFVDAFPSLAFLVFPLLSHSLKISWNDSLYLLAVVAVFYFWQKKQWPWFFVALNFLCLLAPFCLLFLPLFYFQLRPSLQGAGWKFWLKAGLVPLLFYIAVLFVDPSFASAFGRDLANALDHQDLQSFEYFLGADVFHNWFVALDVFKSIMVALLIILTFRFSWRNLFLALVLALCGLPLAGHVWLALGSLFLFSIFAIWEPTEESLPWLTFSFWMTRFFMLMSLPMRFTDLTLYFYVTGKMMHQKVPYIDFTFEYPPLALAPMYIPRLLIELFGSSEFAVYRWTHIWLYFLCDLLFFRFLLAKRKEGQATTAGMWMYVIGGLFLGELIYDRLDLLLGIIFALMMCWAWEKKYFDAILIGVVGVFFKLLTVITFPLLLMDILKTERQNRQRLIYIGFGALLFAGLFIASFWMFDLEFLSFLKYHRDRGIQVETLWSSLYYFCTLLLPEVFSTFKTVPNFGALHVLDAPAFFLRAATLLPVISLLFLYWSYWQAARQGLKEPMVKRYFFLTVLLFVTFGKVLSPQYLIWLICLYPLCGFDIKNRVDKIQSIALIAIVIMSSVLFHFYLYLRDLNILPWILLLVRNLTLTGMVLTEFWILAKRQKSQILENK